MGARILPRPSTQRSDRRRDCKKRKISKDLGRGGCPSIREPRLSGDRREIPCFRSSCLEARPQSTFYMSSRSLLSVLGSASACVAGPSRARCIKPFLLPSADRPLSTSAVALSGHNRWSKIRHRKGAADAERASRINKLLQVRGRSGSLMSGAESRASSASCACPDRPIRTSTRSSRMHSQRQRRGERQKLT